MVINKKYFLLFGLILPLFLLIGCKQLEKRLDDYLFAAQHQWQFEGAALVAVNGKVILSRGYGMANLQIGEPNTPETRFYIGSITKQLTVAAILKLQEDGLLHLDDPISLYLPQYSKTNGDKITIHHLLSHTSGIPNYTDDPEILLRRMIYIPPEEIIDYVKNKPLEFEPGTKFGYSNSNYIILGQIIEKVSGQSYEAYLHRKILKPAGMFNTGYARKDAGIPYRADGYTLEEHGKLIDATPIHFSLLHSAGALYSTVGDLLLWDQALYDGSILSKTSIELMFTPNMEGYGYGCITEERFAQKHIYHGGFLDGFNSIYDRWPDKHLCIVVLSNEDEAPVKKIARGIAAIIFKQPYTWPTRKTPMEIDKTILNEYAGLYRIDDKLFRMVDVIEDSLFTNLSQQPLMQILPQGKDTFFFAADHTRLLVFNRNGADSIAEISIIDDNMLYPGGERINVSDSIASVLKTKLLVAPLYLSQDIIEKYVGEYWLESFTDNDDNKFAMLVFNEGARLFVSVGGAETIEIFARSKTEFFHGVAEFYITFLTDEKNQVTGCEISMSETKITGSKVK